MENVACHFVFYTGPRKGDAETFRTARITIGKAANNDFRLDPTADQVSQHHAEILLENDVYLLYDLGSKAGTYVNGERVHERCVLMNEDYIRFSQDGPEIIFRLGVAIPGKQKLPLVFPVTAEMEFISGSDSGRIFPINAAITTNIGRRADLEIPLDPRGDMIVSGNHCNVRYLDGHFVLMDTSRNGTYVNGDLVEQPMEIIDGDVIMLGDGGPQARFRVDLAKRHYPNHRPLSPVNKPAKPAAPSVSAMKSEPKPAAAPPAPKAELPSKPEKPLASAAPFATGSAPLTAQAAAAAASGVEAIAETVEQSFSEDAVMPAGATAADLEGPGADDEDDEIPSTRVPKEPLSVSPEIGGSEATAFAGAASNRKPTPGFKQRVSSVVPPLHNLKFKPGRNVIIGAVALVVLIGIIMMFSGGSKSELDNIPMQTVESAGFSVKVPEGWKTVTEGEKVSAEPPDKRLALDYVRDPRLNAQKFEQMLLSSGATKSGEPRDIKTDDGTVKVMEATLGNYHRFAALHVPAKGPAMAALLETTQENAKKLTEEDIDRYIVSNVELKPMAGSPAPATPPAPAQAATPEAALPTPSATPAAPAPKEVAKAPEPTAAPSATPEATTPASAPTPASAATAAADETSTDSANMQKVQSKALKLSVSVPKDWKGVSEEADGMLTLADGTGLEIRIARDPGDLDPEATFKAMKEEGWNQDGLMTEDARFKAGEFSKSDQNLLLILIPEKAKTTLVVYATAKTDFTETQRKHIQQVMVQLIP